MWIRTTTDIDSVHTVNPIGYCYIEGTNTFEYYFDDETARALEKAGFLTAMWNKLDATFDWGDYEFFTAQKCIVLKKWLQEQSLQNTSKTIKEVYTT